MPSNTAIRRGAPVGYAILSAFSLVVAIIASVLVHNYNSNQDAVNQGRGFRPRVRLFLAVGWFSWLFSTIFCVMLIMGVGAFFSSIAAHAIFLFIDLGLWVSASAALTRSMYGGMNCSYNVMGIKYCSANNALIAFGFMSMIICFFMLVALVWIAMSSYRNKSAFKEPLTNRDETA